MGAWLKVETVMPKAPAISGTEPCALSSNGFETRTPRTPSGGRKMPGGGRSFTAASGRKGDRDRDAQIAMPVAFASENKHPMSRVTELW